MKIKNIFTRSLLCAIQLFHPSKTCSIRCIVIEALNIRVNNSTPDKSIKMHAIQQPFLLMRFQHKSSPHIICRVRKYSTVDKGHAIFLRWIDPSLLLRCPNCADSAPLPADPPAVSGPGSGLMMLLNIKRIKSCKGTVHVLRINSSNNWAFGTNYPQRNY